jgi:hypothetical protein
MQCGVKIQNTIYKFEAKELCTFVKLMTPTQRASHSTKELKIIHR